MYIVGKGVYDLGDVSRYTGVKVSNLRYWFSSNGVFIPQLDRIGASVSVSFDNLIEVRIAERLRAADVSMQAIRKAVRILREELDTPTPFARREIKTDGKNLFLKIADQDDEKLTDIFTKQDFFPKVMEPYLKTIAYDNKTHLAVLWEIAEGIELNPKVCFGRPVIKGTRIPADMLYNAWLSEGENKNVVAELYKTTPLNVEHAIAFHKHAA